MRIKTEIFGVTYTISFVNNLGKKSGDCDAPHLPKPKIRLLSSLKGKYFLERLLHELLHAVDWSKDEEWIEQASGDIAAICFKEGIKEKLIQALTDE